jgi:hypothetical protein
MTFQKSNLKTTHEYADGIGRNFLLDKLYNLTYNNNAVTPCKSMAYASEKCPPPPPPPPLPFSPPINLHHILFSS